MNESKSALEGLRIEREEAFEEKPRRRWWIWLIVVVLGAGAVGGVLSRGVAVRTVAAREAEVGGPRTLLNASGYVTARREATVSSKVTGKVVEVFLEEGLKVEEGQVLARLDETNVKAGLALAEAMLQASRASLAETRVRIAEAERELHRITALVAGKIATEADLDRAQAELNSLQARLGKLATDVTVAEREVDVRRQDLEDTVIRAPFPGIVTVKTAQPGEMISPISAGGGFTRTGICTLVDMASLEIEVDVNESFINRVRPGQVVEAALDAYSDWKIPCRVIAIIPTADRQKSTVKVRVGFDQLDPRILPDMAVRVAFRGAEAAPTAPAGVVVPEAALGQEDGRDFVWVVQNGRAVRRAVMPGTTNRDEVTLLEGLKSGDQVVVEGAPRLREGVRVRELAPGAQARGREPVMSVTDDVIVRVEGVEKLYRRGAEKVHVLEGIELEVRRGEFLALMGPSGSGKSTLLNLIGGLDRPSRGAITVEGRRIDRLGERELAAWRARHVGFVFQLYNLLPALTAERNVELPLLLTHLNAGRRRRHVHLALQVVGLSHRVKHYPRQLSGGEQQRVGIARAIVTDPTVILADEPTGDLDRKSGDEVLDLLQGLSRDHGKTILMVTHDPHASGRATRTVHLYKGEIVTEAPK